MTPRQLRALRGLNQRGGGMLTPKMVVDLSALGLVTPNTTYNATYPKAPEHWALTKTGRAALETASEAA